MIGRPEWFQRRKYSGWGFSPRTWQGWAYIIIAIALLFAAQLLPASARLPSMTAFALVMCIDYIDIILHLRNDEREKKHEAIAERNVAWVMIMVLTAGIAYQVSSSAIKGIVAVDPFIIAAIACGLVAKIITNIYLDRRD